MCESGVGRGGVNSNKRDEKINHTMREYEAASLRDERLKRKSSEPHILRNGRERGPDIPGREVDDPVPGRQGCSQSVGRYEVEDGERTRAAIHQSRHPPAPSIARQRIDIGENERERGSRDDVEGTDKACNPPKS